MIDASQLPRVPSEVLQKDQQQVAEYARAPAAPGTTFGPLRPDATQRNDR